MKHINITNWQGNITDWTKFNYIYGGLDDTLADRVNLSIPGTNLRNYLKKSDNLLQLANASGTINGITYSVSNGSITLNGTATSGVNIYFEIGEIILNGNYCYNEFSSVSGVSRALRYNTTNVQNLSSPITFSQTNTKANRYLLYIATGTTITNGTIKPMLVKGSTVPTTYEPYGSMVLVENVGRILGLTYENDIIVATTLGGLKCVVIQTDKDFIKDNFRTIVAKNNLNLTNVSANVQWSSTQVNVLACNNSQRILINFDQSLTDEEMIEKAKTLVLDYKLITPKVTVFGQVDLGTLEWVYRTTPHVMQNTQITNIALPPNNGTIANISCPVYKNDTANNVYNNVQDKTISVSSTGILQVYDSAYTDATIFKSAMNGVILIYEAKNTSSANTLSMASPMQLQDNVEDITDNISVDELLEPANEER